MVAQAARFRILAIDGGGIRGLIPAIVLRELERRLVEETGEDRPLCDWFHLFAGTSTGGLLALALTAPDPLRGEQLVQLYSDPDQGPRIFADRHGFDGWTDPKYTHDELRRVLEEQIGRDVRLSQARRELVVTSYDMHGREPFFFKRWRAVESDERDQTMVEAGIATASAPTYFPSFALGDRALVDGGVFAANPTIAAIAEALKRRDDPGELVPHELFAVSLGTGSYERSYEQRDVAGWGKIGWITPSGGGEPPILAAMLDGQSDAADHWAHMLLNHEPQQGVPAAIGRGERYYRLQVKLPGDYAMDDARQESLERLSDAADRLLADRSDDVEAIVAKLVELGPLPPLAD